MSRTYTAAIFDFEGTLVDFQWQLAPAEAELRGALATLGFAGGEFASGNYATLWNAAADSLAPRGRMAELRQALCPIYDRWDLDALSRWVPRPGAAQMLRRLTARGWRTGIVSNIGRNALAAALGRFELTALLAPVVTRDEVTFMKPRAEGILRVLEEWRVAASDTLFVGDSRADVLGARAAGTRVAIIRGGECDDAAFADARPDHVISRLDELVVLAADG
jgi:phosphoglycolate phosphatase-like HAD superfamily hydrolase